MSCQTNNNNSCRQMQLCLSHIGHVVNNPLHALVLTSIGVHTRRALSCQLACLWKVCLVVYTSCMLATSFDYPGPFGRGFIAFRGTGCKHSTKHEFARMAEIAARSCRPLPRYKPHKVARNTILADRLLLLWHYFRKYQMHELHAARLHLLLKLLASVSG
jgi:hypothetical protein